MYSNPLIVGWIEFFVRFGEKKVMLRISSVSFDSITAAHKNLMVSLLSDLAKKEKIQEKLCVLREELVENFIIDWLS